MEIDSVVWKEQTQTPAPTPMKSNLLKLSSFGHSLNIVRSISLFVTVMLLITQLVPAAETPPPIEWQRVFGGSGSEGPRGIVASGDGGFMLMGYSQSGPSGNKTSPPYGGWDYW